MFIFLHNGSNVASSRPHLASLWLTVPLIRTLYGFSCLCMGIRPPVNAAARSVAVPFSRWAQCVQRDGDLNKTACMSSCCDLLGAYDRRLGKQCYNELLDLGVYYTLGEATAADWEDISERLAQRVGTQAQHPAWLPEDPQEATDSVSERLRRACCSSEVAVLMLRLAVRAACLDSSWYGPWDSMAALAQLGNAHAWSSLMHAMNALLANFGADLAKQYNAFNIVSDILHVSTLCT